MVIFQRMKCLNPKCWWRIYDIEVVPFGKPVLEFPHNTFKNGKKSETYILAGVMRFTMNVDCSAPAFFIHGNRIHGNYSM